MKHPVFMVIDGSSLLHRAFYAIPPLSNSQGIPTNAVLGFLNMLERLRREYRPDYLVVALDKSRQTFRSETYQAYKAQRSATPDELKPQFGLLKDVLSLQRVPVFEMEGFEADDLIGTLCCRAVEKGIYCLIVTGDRDAWQLISPGVEVILTRKGISEIERYDEDTLREKVGLAPAQVIDWKGLMGDASDNIPGVPGVGEKTAFKLLEQFGSMEAIYERLDEVKGKLREKLADNREQAFMSKKLATIVCDMSLEVNWEACRVSSPDIPALRKLYTSLEFRSLLRNLPVAEPEADQRPSEQGTRDSGREEGQRPELKSPALPLRNLSYRIVESENHIAEMLADLMKYGHQSVGKTAVLATWEGSPRTGRIVQLAVAVGTPEAAKIWVVDAPHGIFESTQLFWTSSEHPKIFFDAKAVWLFCRQEDIEMDGLTGDGLLGAYLLDPLANNYTLARTTHDILGWEISPNAGREVLPASEAAQGVACLLHLLPAMEEKLTQEGLLPLYRDIELSLVSILASMEWAGISVDPAILKVMAEELNEDLNQLQADIYDHAGDSFNINSTQQLGKILFEKLGLPVIKKTKTGYSTDVEVLEELAGYHLIVPKVLEYRQLMKLKSTYVEGLLTLIDPTDGRIHTSFNQAVTATGRLSSTEPNLQNIPIRLEHGRRIRKAFIAPDDQWLLLAADYSQIELRILAHLSGDSSLKDAFVKQQDIHTRTASEVFGVAMDEVTSEMRRRAKAVNFGIVYGIGDFSLGRDLNVPRAEARRYIDGYFQRYQGVKDYIDRTIALAREKGFVTTILGRQRKLPDLFVKNKIRQAFGERTAMNTPIQGSAADIIKAAMVRISRLLKEQDFATRMLLQVHDELIFEVPKHELERVAPLIKQGMEETIQLDIPLVVDTKIGANWYEMRPYSM